LNHREGSLTESDDVKAAKKEADREARIETNKQKKLSAPPKKGKKKEKR